MPERRPSKTEERSFTRMLEELEAQEWAFERFKRTRSLVPEGWQAAARRAPVAPRKAKLTLSLDDDMIKWFRGLGRGYQPRMNAVLRAYMQAVISKTLAQQGDRDRQGEGV